MSPMDSGVNEEGAASITNSGESVTRKSTTASGGTAKQTKQMPQVQAQISSRRELLSQGRVETSSRDSMSTLRKLYKRGRRVLLALRMALNEGARDRDEGDSGTPAARPAGVGDAPKTENSTPADARPIDVAGCGIEKINPASRRRPAERETSAIAARNRRERRDRHSIERKPGRDLDSRRYCVAIEETGKGTGTS
jgi:hypothetical protein